MAKRGWFRQCHNRWSGAGCMDESGADKRIIWRKYVCGYIGILLYGSGQVVIIFLVLLLVWENGKKLVVQRRGEILTNSLLREGLKCYWLNL